MGVHDETGVCGAGLGGDLIVGGVEIVGDVAVPALCSCISAVVFWSSVIRTKADLPVQDLRSATKMSCRRLSRAGPRCLSLRPSGSG